MSDDPDATRVLDTRKIILEKDGIKREITMPFRICLHRAAATRLREELLKADACGFTYGWIDVQVDELPHVTGPVKTWTE